MKLEVHIEVCWTALQMWHAISLNIVIEKVLWWQDSVAEHRVYLYVYKIQSTNQKVVIFFFTFNASPWIHNDDDTL